MALKASCLGIISHNLSQAFLSEPQSPDRYKDKARVSILRNHEPIKEKNLRLFKTIYPNFDAVALMIGDVNLCPSPIFANFAN